MGFGKTLNILFLCLPHTILLRASGEAFYYPSCEEADGICIYHEYDIDAPFSVIHNSCYFSIPDGDE